MAGGALLGTGIQVDRNDDWTQEQRVELAFDPIRFRQDKHGYYVQDLSLQGAMYVIRLILSVFRAANKPIYDVNGDLMWLPPQETSDG